MSSDNPRSNPFSLGGHEPNRIVGERIGNQRPTNEFIPEITDTRLAEKALRFLDLIGFTLDDWQQWTLRQMLGCRDDGTYSCKEFLLLVPRQCGKAVRCTAPVLTTNGWTTFGEIEPGAEVFGPDGRPRKVLATSPVMTGHKCYRVTTSDGRSEIFDAEHLWTVIDKKRERSRGSIGNRVRWFDEVTLTTQEMLESGLQRSNRTNGHNEYRYQLPRQHALSGLPKADLPIDPYLFGAWLGDGSSGAGELTCGDDDLEHWCATVSEAGYTPTVRRHKDRAPTVGITAHPGRGRHSRSLIGKLRGLGVLGNKHIPGEYLIAADVQREALLQGLLDTDGSCSKVGRVEFCSTNKALAEGTLFLARSLGWRATLKEDRARIDGRDCGPRYRVSWTPTMEDDFICFRLERKLNNVKKQGTDSRFTVSIMSIEPVESEPVRCIRVDAEDGLFLAGRDLIVTHNTRILEARAIVGLYILKEPLIVHTAQVFPTCRESYLRLKSVIDAIPELAEKTHFRAGNDNLSIEFEGRRILYKARGTNPIRGFSPQVIIADEAYAVDDEIAAAVENALSAQRNPQFICTSSTGLDDSDWLLRMRDRALEEAGRFSLGLAEWCALPNCNLDDIEEYYRATPALGIRISLETVLGARRSQGDKQFGRERLGLWADNKFRCVIDLDHWNNNLKNPKSQITSRYVVAIDATPSAPHDASVAIAGFTDEGKRQIEVLHGQRGLDWCVENIQRLYLATRNPPPLAICVQAGSVAGRLIPELQKIRDRDGELAEVIPFSQRDVTDSCGFFFDSVTDSKLVHLGDSSLASALSGATRIRVGKLDGPKGEEEYRAWYWGRKDTLVDISPLCAVTYALWGLNMKTSEAELNKKHYEGKPFGGGLWRTGL